MSTNTIFDLIEDEIPEGKEGYMEFAKRAPSPKNSSFLNDIANYGKTILKGSIEGLSRLGKGISPLQNYEGLTSEEELQQQSNALDELLPTDEGFAQSSIRRGLRQAPTMLAFPASTLSTLPRSIAAGFLGEGAQELGAPEWAQAAAELTAYLSPNITKKLIESGNNKEIIRKARDLGLSDEQITPLLQSDFKQKWLIKLAPKRGKTETILSNTKEGLGSSYQKIKESPLAKQNFSPELAEDTFKSIEKSLKEMPHTVREKITKDYSDLLNSPKNLESFINFWSDINYELGPKTKQLSLLKEPIRNLIQNVSPELAKDFETINTLYSKFYPIAQRLKPNLMSDIAGAVKAISLPASLIFGISTGYFPILFETLSYDALSRISREMLTNPRFQQIGNKMVSALKENKFGVVNKLTSLLRREVNKADPEIADQIENLSKEEIQELYEAMLQQK